MVLDGELARRAWSSGRCRSRRTRPTGACRHDHAMEHRARHAAVASDDDRSRAALRERPGAERRRVSSRRPPASAPRPPGRESPTRSPSTRLRPAMTPPSTRSRKASPARRWNKRIVTASASMRAGVTAGPGSRVLRSRTTSPSSPTPLLAAATRFPVRLEDGRAGRRGRRAHPRRRCSCRRTRACATRSRARMASVCVYLARATALGIPADSLALAVRRDGSSSAARAPTTRMSSAPATSCSPSSCVVARLGGPLPSRRQLRPRAACPRRVGAARSLAESVAARTRRRDRDLRLGLDQALSAAAPILANQHGRWRARRSRGRADGLIAEARSRGARPRDLLRHRLRAGGRAGVLQRRRTSRAASTPSPRHADAVARGELRRELAFESDDELGELADSFRKMTSGLRALIADIDGRPATSPRPPSSLASGAQQMSASTQQVSGAARAIAEAAAHADARASTTRPRHRAASPRAPCWSSSKPNRHATPRDVAQRTTRRGTVAAAEALEAWRPSRGHQGRRARPSRSSARSRSASARSPTRSARSRGRPTCSRSTPPSRRRAPASTARDSPSSPTRCASLRARARARSTDPQARRRDPQRAPSRTGEQIASGERPRHRRRVGHPRVRRGAHRRSTARSRAARDAVDRIVDASDAQRDEAEALAREIEALAAVGREERRDVAAGERRRRSSRPPR